MNGNDSYPPERTAGGIVPESGEVVMGLRWDIQEHLLRGHQRHPDLDAVCVILDAQARVVEIVHPGHPRNANDSVVHTGDSRTGAKAWDDERIVVFLEPLPENAAALAFVVASASGHVFGNVPGASAHVSDAASEREYVRVDLSMYGFAVARCIATLQRTADGWRLYDRAASGRLAVSAESLSGLLDKKDAEGNAARRS